MARKKIANPGQDEKQDKNNPGITDSVSLSAGSNQDDSVPVKKRGRPAGSKNKCVRKDHDINSNTGSGENSHMIKYAMAFSALPDVDINDLVQVNQRVTDLFSISAAYDIKPSVAALAMAFHVSRATIFDWLTEKYKSIKNKACLDAIKMAYNQINLLYETYMNCGKINPVSGIFLMKNNMGYKDTTDYIITPNHGQSLSISDITGKAGLLED